MKRFIFDDPLLMPRTNESCEELYERAVFLQGTPGEEYVKRRGIPLEIAHSAGLKFCENLAGRPAVLVRLFNVEGKVTSVHARYFKSHRGHNKMLTIGPGDGLISVLDGWKTENVIIVEGLFDALSLATCGWPAVAPIGRKVSWIANVTAGKKVWLAFDACKPAEADVCRYREILKGSQIFRLPPPFRCKDWNTALVKWGDASVSRWIRFNLIDNPPTH